MSTLHSPISAMMARIMPVVMGRLLPDCEETSHRVSEAMDSRLLVSRWIGMRVHLMMCAFCRRYKLQLDILRQVAQAGDSDNQVPVQPMPAETRERIRSAIRSASRQNE